METKYGKILSFEIGYGGYNDAMFGATVTLGGNGWATVDFINAGWFENISPNPDPDKGGWRESDRANMRASFVRKLDKILSESKKTHVSELQGVPVIVLFDEIGKLNHWEILVEVL